MGSLTAARKCPKAEATRPAPWFDASGASCNIPARFSSPDAMIPSSDAPVPDARSHGEVFRPDVTVATVVPRDGRLLFVEERVRGELVLNQPAGHLEAGESLYEAALRETLEETGWAVRLTHFIGLYRWDADDGNAFIRVAFAAEPLRHDPARPLDHGIERALWLTPAELRAAAPRLRSPLVAAVAEDFLGGARWPLAAVRSFL